MIKRMGQAQKYTVDQERVDRKFCAEKCAAFFKIRKICGTLYAPGWRKNKCLWEKPKIKKSLTANYANSAKGF